MNIGDPWPFASTRGLTGRPLREPKWFALVVAPQKEPRVAQQLQAAGVQVEYPVDERVRHRNGKKYVYHVPMISRIVYAKFDFEPQWDVLKDRRIITGVFCNGTAPVVVKDSTVRLICNLPEVEDELERARIAALTPDVGETVQLLGGLFAGMRVDVVKSEQGRVWYSAITDIGKMDGTTTIEAVQRLAGAG